MSFLLSILPSLEMRNTALLNQRLVRRLCDAALKDEGGTALAGALKTIDSFL